MKSYLITDPVFYGSDAETLKHTLEGVFLHHSVDFALFRDKQTQSYTELATVFIDVCRKNRVNNILLHGDALLAHRLGANGVHLASYQHIMISEAKSLGLYVVISTHTHTEALKAQELGADAITYSPIFYSPNKGEPKGLEDLKEIMDKIKVPIFALGGIITSTHIKAIEKCGACGFASIRYFIENQS